MRNRSQNRIHAPYSNVLGQAVAVTTCHPRQLRLCPSTSAAHYAGLTPTKNQSTQERDQSDRRTGGGVAQDEDEERSAQGSGEMGKVDQAVRKVRYVGKELRSAIGKVANLKCGLGFHIARHVFMIAFSRVRGHGFTNNAALLPQQKIDIGGGTP